MSRKDQMHETVRIALEKDGWRITHDPLVLPLGRRTLKVDLGAEAPFAAEKAGQKIAVEVKSFVGVSEITEWERALGQYMLYRFVLRRKEPERIIYLAIPPDAYKSLFNEEDEREFAEAENLKILIFNPEVQEVIRWIH